MQRAAMDGMEIPMRFWPATLIIPQELAPAILTLSIVVAGLLVMIGLRKLALTVVVSAFLLLFLPVLLEPMLDQIFASMPLWLVVVVGIVVLFIVVKALFVLLIGQQSSDHMIGILAADVVRTVVRAPFVLLRWVFGLFRR